MSSCLCIISGKRYAFEICLDRDHSARSIDVHVSGGEEVPVSLVHGKKTCTTTLSLEVDANLSCPILLGFDWFMGMMDCSSGDVGVLFIRLP